MDDLSNQDRYLDNLCFVVAAEYVESTVDSTVLPPTTPEERALALITGEDAEERREVTEVGGHTEPGLKVTLKFPRTQKSYERFLSETWIREHLEERFGQGFPTLTKQQIEKFGEALKKRRDPIHIGMFDANVELEQVKFDPTVAPPPKDPPTPTGRPKITGGQ